MWQEVAVFIIGLVAVGYIGYKIYRMLSGPTSNDPCCGCGSCALKEELRKKAKGQKPTCQYNDK